MKLSYAGKCHCGVKKSFFILLMIAGIELAGSSADPDPAGPPVNTPKDLPGSSMDIAVVLDIHALNEKGE